MIELAKVNGLKIEIKSSITDYTDVEMFRDYLPITKEEIIKQAIKELKEEKNENAS